MRRLGLFRQAVTKEPSMPFAVDYSVAVWFPL